MNEVKELRDSLSSDIMWMERDIARVDEYKGSVHREWFVEKNIANFNAIESKCTALESKCNSQLTSVNESVKAQSSLIKEAEEERNKAQENYNSTKKAAEEHVRTFNANPKPRFDDKREEIDKNKKDAADRLEKAVAKVKKLKEELFLTEKKGEDLKKIKREFVPGIRSKISEARSKISSTKIENQTQFNQAYSPPPTAAQHPALRSPTDTSKPINQLSTHVPAELPSSKNQQIDSLVSAFISRFERNPKYIKPESNADFTKLTFPSADDANAFFKEQAEEISANTPIKFFAQQLDTPFEKGKHFFSCGDGKLYQGTPKEIQDELTKRSMECPNDPNIKQGMEDINKYIEVNMPKNTGSSGTNNYSGDSGSSIKPETVDAADKGIGAAI